MARRVDFFIVGVQKGGTTALAAYLAQHPQIEMSRVKEVHHFDDEVRVDWSAPSHERLHAQFEWQALHRLRGEATPITIYWPSALARLRNYNPAARVLLGLRHPSLRAWSHWRMEKARGNDALDFAEAVSERGRQRVVSEPGGVHRIYSYVERGFYEVQIRNLLMLFPRQQVLFFSTEQLWLETAPTLASIERFLGLEPVLAATAKPRYIVPIAPVAAPAMSRATRRRLDALYESDIRRTAELTGLNLSHWLDPGYREPMSPDDSGVRG